jgi:hypothetical protein
VEVLDCLTNRIVNRLAVDRPGVLDNQDNAATTPSAFNAGEYTMRRKVASKRSREISPAHPRNLFTGSALPCCSRSDEHQINKAVAGYLHLV